MAVKDIIMLRQKDLKRLHIIHKAMEGAITQGKAAELAGLSERQIRRIVARIKEEGDGGIGHKGRGKLSNRKKQGRIKERIIQLYRQKYQGFGPTLTMEKLFEEEGLEISKETVRSWLIEAELWRKRRKRKQHRQWRQRKACCGEMVQLDGSHHDWFEGRGPKCVLMAYIDDATGRVYCRFYEYEGTIPAMDSFRRYIRKYGIPLSLYMDKHTTYKSPAEPTIEDEINGTEPLSEFGRALTELGVEIIHAHSPQAKGRVERLFGTLQDRIVKEMRLKGIKSIEEANAFLDYYLPQYNRKFMVIPQQKDNLHRRIPRGLNLERILCIKTPRSVGNDNTISHNGKLYQIEQSIAKKKVTVEERVNGTMRIMYGEAAMKFKEIHTRPQKLQKKPLRLRRRGVVNTPAADHPWRKFDMNRHKRIQRISAEQCS